MQNLPKPLLQRFNCCCCCCCYRNHSFQANVRLMVALKGPVIGFLKRMYFHTFEFRIVFKVLLLVYKALNGMAPPYLSDILCYRLYSRSLRSASQKLIVVHRTNMKTYGDRAFSIAGPKLWNQLPLSIRELSSIDSFKKSLKTYLFRLAYS